MVLNVYALREVAEIALCGWLTDLSGIGSKNEFTNTNRKDYAAIEPVDARYDAQLLQR